VRLLFSRWDIPMTMVDQELFPFPNLVSLRWRAQLVMAASHPRRDRRLCLAEGSEAIFDMWG